MLVNSTNWYDLVIIEHYSMPAIIAKPASFIIVAIGELTTFITMQATFATTISFIDFNSSTINLLQATR
jgi:hypothetical protein